MSDDTPTQRLPESGGTPTERISTGEIQEDLQEEKQRSKGLLIGLIVAGLLLLIAIIVLLIIVFGAKGTGEPDASGTPSAPATPSAAPSQTPSATPEPTEEPSNDPPSTPGPVINSFSTGTGTVSCPGSVELTITWSTTGGSRVYFGIDTNDASAAPFFDNLPNSGNSNSDFPAGYSPFTYSCGSETHTYTLTVVDTDGNKQSKTVTVKDLSGNQ